jgi:hypothetical protein
MALIIEQQPIRFTWATVMNLTEFPDLLRLFHTRVPSRPDKKPNTGEIEKRGAELAEHNFPETELKEFIRTVCNWGGYPGIAGRIMKHNQPNELVEHFSDAYKNAGHGKIVGALKSLQEVNQLGSVSFASKHLKFLAPNSAVVLDSIISGRLGYPMTPDGYQIFLTDCHAILRQIVDARLEYTGQGAKEWRVSDVEMAITAKLRFEDSLLVDTGVC